MRSSHDKNYQFDNVEISPPEERYELSLNRKVRSIQTHPRRDLTFNCLKSIRILPKRAVSRVLEACFNRLTRVSNVEPVSHEDE